MNVLRQHISRDAEDIMAHSPARVLIEMDSSECERMREQLGSVWEWEGVVRIIEPSPLDDAFQLVGALRKHLADAELREATAVAADNGLRLSDEYAFRGAELNQQAKDLLGLK